MPPAGSPVAGGLALKASLTLNKADLRAIEETLLLRIKDRNPPSKEYRFAESGFKQLAAADVPAEIFHPDPGRYSKRRLLKVEWPLDVPLKRELSSS